MGSARRNDPCPCGSGRKFKHCCLRALDAEDAARTRLRVAEGILVPALFAYAADEFGDEFLGSYPISVIEFSWQRQARAAVMDRRDKVRGPNERAASARTS